MNRCAVQSLLLAVGLCTVSGCALRPPPAGRGEPQVANYHAEDDHVRIDELRVRGQVTRISVSPKVEGLGKYEVLPPSGGQDPSLHRDAAGQLVWNVLTF